MPQEQCDPGQRLERLITGPIREADEDEREHAQGPARPGDPACLAALDHGTFPAASYAQAVIAQSERALTREVAEARLARETSRPFRGMPWFVRDSSSFAPHECRLVGDEPGFTRNDRAFSRDEPR